MEISWGEFAPAPDPMVVMIVLIVPEQVLFISSHVAAALPTPEISHDVSCILLPVVVLVVCVILILKISSDPLLFIEK